MLRLQQTQPNGIYWCHFHLLISHKVVSSMAKLISQSCGELQPAVCLPRGYAAIWRQPVHSWHVWQASETSHSKSNPGNFQHQYLAELLVNVYSYCLMVKSVSFAVVCVEAGFSQIWSQLLIIIIEWHNHVLLVSRSIQVYFGNHSILQ